MYLLPFLLVTLALPILTSPQPSPFGQLLLAYYSGVGGDTVGSGGLNAMSLAFFAPAPMASGSCDFTNPQTPCLRPAAGAGPSLGLAWALSTINSSIPLLSRNTSPNRGGKPTIFFFIWWTKRGWCWLGQHFRKCKYGVSFWAELRQISSNRFFFLFRKSFYRN